MPNRLFGSSYRFSRAKTTARFALFFKKAIAHRPSAQPQIFPGITLPLTPHTTSHLHPPTHSRRLDHAWDGAPLRGPDGKPEGIR
jgi:hypothetical protein